MAKKKNRQSINMGAVLLIGAAIYLLSKQRNTGPGPSMPDPVPQIPMDVPPMAVSGHRNKQRHFSLN